MTKGLVDSGIVRVIVVICVSSMEVLSREILVVTESTLKVNIVAERVVVSEYEDSALLDSVGTVNVYSVGATVTVVAAIASSAEVEMVVMTVVVIPSNVTCVVIPSVIISIVDDST